MINYNVFCNVGQKNLLCFFILLETESFYLCNITCFMDKKEFNKTHKCVQTDAILKQQHWGKQQILHCTIFFNHKKSLGRTYWFCDR